MNFDEAKTIYRNYMEFFIDHIVTYEIRKRIPGIGHYVFRGESSSEYDLLPNVLREKNEQVLMDCSAHIINATSNPEQKNSEGWFIDKEYALLSKFYRYANQQGLNLPSIKLFTNSSMQCDNSIAYISRQPSPYKWYSEEIAELAALAQHYGCLTRMLDWTYDILTALFFAVHSALVYYRENNEKWQSEYIRIWALESYGLGTFNPNDARSQLCAVVPNYHSNPNLGAQRGLLTYWRLQINTLGDWNTVPVDRTPLDQKINDCYPHIGAEFPPIYQFLIPSSDCLNAYQSLRRLGYTSDRLFPGYQGVKKRIDDDIMIAELFGGRA